MSTKNWNHSRLGNELWSGSRLQFEWKACGCTAWVSGPRCGPASAGIAALEGCPGL